MIDTDKYEGHTEGEWVFKHINSNWYQCDKIGEIHMEDIAIKEASANTQLIADAPLLLEAYKQIHDLLAEVLPRKDGVPHFGTALWGLESELKRVVNEIAIIMGMAEREEE